MYTALRDAGLKPIYEPYKTILISGFKFTINMIGYWPTTSKGSSLKLYNNILSKSYTVDFIIETDKIDFYIECKGFANDDYVSKKKLFLKILNEKYENSDKHVVFLEPHNKKHVYECVDIILNKLIEVNNA